MIPGFNEQLKILTEEGVDLIILEAMTSKDETVESIIECSSKIDLPIWLSISCVFDKNKKIPGLTSALVFAEFDLNDRSRNNSARSIYLNPSQAPKKTNIQFNGGGDIQFRKHVGFGWGSHGNSDNKRYTRSGLAGSATIPAKSQWRHAS